jgi:hypothetical protein
MHTVNGQKSPRVQFSMEINLFFYLRHIFSMDRQFCIPFIIISHMKHAYRVKNINLSYANLIA